MFLLFESLKNLHQNFVLRDTLQICYFNDNLDKKKTKNHKSIKNWF